MGMETEGEEMRGERAKTREEEGREADGGGERKRENGRGAKR